MSTVKDKLYIRAEPTEEGRKNIALNQHVIAKRLRKLNLSPRLAKVSDFHYTVLFIGSAETWRKALRVSESNAQIARKDLVSLVINSQTKITVDPIKPKSYDLLINGKNKGAVVIRLSSEAESLTKKVVRNMESTLFKWQKEGKLAPQTIPKLFTQRNYPPTRDREGGKPHITLARVKFSPERKKGIKKALQNTSLASSNPISFKQLDLRVVQKGEVLKRLA